VNFGNHQDVVYGKEASNRDCTLFSVTCLLSPRFYWEDSGTKWNMEAKPSQALEGSYLLLAPKCVSPGGLKKADVGGATL